MITCGDALTVLPTLPERLVQMCATSPPYWGLRDYGLSPQNWPAVDFAPMPGLPMVSIPAQEGCLGLEPDPWAFIGHLVLVFQAVRRVLRDDGVLFLNLGDSYAGGGRAGKNPEYQARHTMFGKAAKHTETFGVPLGAPAGLKAKDLCGMPWRVAFALQADGWYLRSDVIWEKPNPMPESCTDRPTRAHEYVFVLSKSPQYFWDKAAVAEPSVDPNHPRTVLDNGPQEVPPGTSKHKGLRRSGVNDVGEVTQTTRNLRSVWTTPTQPYRGAHFATWPEALVERMVLAGSRFGNVVLDPFGGSGTTAQVSRSLGRDSILIEPNPSYVQLAEDRYWTPTRKEKAMGITAEFLDRIRRSQ